MGKRGRAYVEQFYTRQRVTEQYEHLFAELIAAPKRGEVKQRRSKPNNIV